ncbi:MAG: SLOG family protein [Candidatus Heritagella sp.]
MEMTPPVGRTCCFSSQFLPPGHTVDRRALKSRIRQLLAGSAPVTRFLCGMEKNGDLDAAEILLHLKDTAPFPLRLECFLPYEEQAAHWDEPTRERYFSILARCDEVHLLETRYTPGCRQRRDRFMTRQSDLLLFLTPENRPPITAPAGNLLLFAPAG